MSDETTDSVNALDLTRHYWRRRLFLLLLPPVIFVLAYLFIKYFVPETYQATAQLMLRTAPSELRDAPRMREVDPPVYEDFLLNDELLFSVLQEAREEYPESFNRAHFEDFRKAFRVNTIMTRDTSVQAIYSPVLVLKVLAGSPDHVHFLAKTWVDLSLRSFGQLRTQEARAVETAMSEQFDVHAQEGQVLARREAMLATQLEQIDLLISSQRRLLLGGGTAIVRVQQNAQLDDATQAEAGLQGERVRLELELASAGAISTADAQERVDVLSARLEKLDEVVARIILEKNELQEQRVNVTVDLEEVRRNLLIAREKMSLLRSVMTTALADAQSIPDWLKPENSGDLLRIADPIKPEKRVGPPRLLLSLAITVIFLGLMLLFFGLELFFKRAVIGRT